MEAQVANALLADATVRALAADASVAVDAPNVSTPPTPQFALTPAQWAAAAHMAPPRLPTLHVVPVAEPSDVDAGGQSLSAGMPPASLEAVRKVGTQADASSANDDATMQAAATTATSVVYTPAQIRLAYGLGAFPAATTANKGSYQGSGQMIAIINAYHNASAGTNLNAFATKFGLPTCTLLGSAYKAGATLAAMVPAPKAGDSCTFQTVYVNAAGAVVSTAPATNASWATEINLDVQWAHAIAPNAKIVLIEAASATGTAMAAAMQLASKLGASAISMSYGSTEYAQVTTLDPVLTGTATWVAASGDSGVEVEWPAASPAALAVGGTLLSNVSPRAEAAWSGSGGGLSVYEKMPSFQSSVTVPGNPANTTANASKMRRGVPDVAYNASPSSGFYLYQSGSWYSVGGTSAGTPQWAAMVALANAVRSLNGKTAFSGTGFQQAVYGAAAASTYRSNYLDITSGSNGTCTTCKTLTGYDLVTGLGTPNFGALLPALVALK
jgi:subtilase family serine protease